MFANKVHSKQRLITKVLHKCFGTQQGSLLREADECVTQSAVIVKASLNRFVEFYNFIPLELTLSPCHNVDAQTEASLVKRNID